MLVAAALCPHPPVLVPEVAVGAAGELDELRRACADAVDTLARRDPDEIVVVGAADVTGELRGTGGTLAPYGVAVRTGTGAPTLPLAHTIGGWLLDRVGWPGPRVFWGAAAEPVSALDEAGALLGGRAGRVAVLAVGDGSARRTEKAPGYFDPRAEDFDAAAAAALASGPAAVLGLDRELAADVLAAGWPAWHLLARAAAGQDWRAELLHTSAPYGVGYIVARWLPR